MKPGDLVRLMIGEVWVLDQVKWTPTSTVQLDSASGSYLELRNQAIIVLEVGIDYRNIEWIRILIDGKLGWVQSMCFNPVQPEPEPGKVEG